MSENEIIPFSINALRRIGNIIVSAIRQQKSEDEPFDTKVMLYDLYFPGKRGLVSFFRRAGLPEDSLVDFEQLTAFEFLARIQDRPDGRDQIIRIIEQLCDPEEYFDNPKSREAVVKQINEVITRYNLKVSEKGKVLTSPLLIITNDAVNNIYKLLTTPIIPEKAEGQSPKHEKSLRLMPRSKQNIFVCYSHVDIKWLEQLQVHLKPLERQGIIELWDDTKILAGTLWQEEIEKALGTASIAVTLVSPHFLASDFISKYELPTLLSHAESGGTRILSVILSHCLFNDSGLDIFQTVNPPSRPMKEMSRVARDKIWVKLAKAIQESLERGKA